MSNSGGLYTWSKTAANNAGFDSSVNWAEGQAPSSINDSARNMMASAAKYRDDIAGAIVTSGTSAAYIVASNQQFDTLANFSGQVIAFTPHVTNAAGPVTVTVDGFANLPLRTSPGKELLFGTIIQGTPYTASYNNTDGALYLHGFYGNPYNVPLAAGMDYWGSTAPNSSFAFPVGQTISQTTYAALFAIFGTTYNIGGEAAGTFRIPDKRGRVSAMLDNTGTIITSATISPNGNSLGGAGGSQQQVLTTANLPAYTPAGTMTLSVTSTTNNVQVNSAGTLSINNPGGSSTFPIFNNSSISSTGTGTLAGTAQGGTSTPTSNVQPTIVCNYIIRII
jgi:microcystin-dependent protein